MQKNKATKEFILDWLKKYYDTYGDFPNANDWKSSGQCPFKWTLIHKYFDSFKNACEIATGQKYTRYNDPAKVVCKNCNIEFYKKNSEIRLHPNNFCSRSCSATYNNKHKKHGNRRSKLEIYIEKRLKEEFPNLQVLYNDKTTINSELDIYFPDLRIAVELNGIFHYEPIYGHDRLEKIRNNDKQKLINCYNKRYRTSHNRFFQAFIF